MAGEVIATFDAAVQKLEALNSAAYRMAAAATCEISLKEGRYECRLNTVGSDDPETVKIRFMQAVADENIRADLRLRTEPVRNLILSLAFGALAVDGERKAGV